MCRRPFTDAGIVYVGADTKMNSNNFLPRNSRPTTANGERALAELGLSDEMLTTRQDYSMGFFSMVTDLSDRNELASAKIMLVPDKTVQIESEILGFLMQLNEERSADRLLISATYLEAPAVRQIRLDLLELYRATSGGFFKFINTTNNGIVIAINGIGLRSSACRAVLLDALLSIKQKDE